MAWTDLLYRALFIVSICFCLQNYICNRDIGQMCPNAKKIVRELSHKRFVAQLMQDIDLCSQNDGSVCCRSKSYISERTGEPRYENCKFNGLAIFLHTTAPKGFQCCPKSDHLKMDHKKRKRYNVSNFVTEMKTFKTISMCVVQMQTEDGEFHIFSLELRPATDKSVMYGFYVYSSW